MLQPIKYTEKRLFLGAHLRLSAKLTIMNSESDVSIILLRDRDHPQEKSKYVSTSTSGASRY